MKKIVNLEEIVVDTDNPVRKIMFVFHGYGADNENIAQVGVEISKGRPDIEVYVQIGRAHV
jgi:predicted esterase